MRQRNTVEEAEGLAPRQQKIVQWYYKILFVVVVGNVHERSQQYHQQKTGQTNGLCGKPPLDWIFVGRVQHCAAMTIEGLVWS